jgi:hypothetical protein
LSPALLLLTLMLPMSSATVSSTLGIAFVVAAPDNNPVAAAMRPIFFSSKKK